MTTRTATRAAVSQPAANVNTLLPFTKLVLVVSAVVQTVFGIVGFFFNDLWNRVFWTAPLHTMPQDIAQFAFANYLATAIAAAYALRQGSWQGAKVYFAFSFPYIIISVLVTLYTASYQGVPTIMWLYVALSVLYLPAVAFAWFQQSRAQRGN